MEQQITLRKNVGESPANVPGADRQSLTWWRDQYFQFGVTAAPSSRQVQRRDIGRFLDYMGEEEGSHTPALWSPRLTRAFLEHLRTATDEKTGHRRWGDRTARRIMDHLKTFARWINQYEPFPLGDPMAGVKVPALGTGLEISRALTGSERRRILDAADRLPAMGGLSRDRHRYRNKIRPQRQRYRPYRNRAMIYTLMETGMRRAGVVNLLLGDVDFRRHTVTVREKGGQRHKYHISSQGLGAIRDYIVQERHRDSERWGTDILFLTCASTPGGTGQLSLPIVNSTWNEVCRAAGVEGKTPHSARHAMGRYIVEKTGNAAAVQRQLGHRDAAFSLQYMRVTDDEIREVLDAREE